MAEAIAGELLLLRPSVTKKLCDAAKAEAVCPIQRGIADAADGMIAALTF
jgi:hypothetical protein